MSTGNLTFALGFNPHVTGEARDSSMKWTPFYNGDSGDDSEDESADNCQSKTRAMGKTFCDNVGLLDVKRVFPILKWLPNYKKSSLVGDIVAGITVGLMVIPQGMAYASIAGLPPVYGLYSAFMGVIVYFFTGTSKDITLGPTALMSLIVAESFTELPHPYNETHYTYDMEGINSCTNIESYDHCCRDGEDFSCTPVKMAVAATMVSGIIQIVMGFLNFGFIIDFIGFHVLNGFTTAAAITIAFSQVKHIFGLKDVSREFFHVEPDHGINSTEHSGAGGAIRDVFVKLPETRWQDLIMGLGAMLITWLLEKVKAKYNKTRDDSWGRYIAWICGTARNALVVGIGLVVARIVWATNPEAGEIGEAGFDQVNRSQFTLVGEVPAGLPKLSNPFDSDTLVWGELASASITIAMLGYLESIAIGKTFAQKNGYRLDPTQELRAIGLANVISSFFQSYPVTGSFSRTAVNAASNVESPLGGVFTGIVVILSLVLFTPAFFFIPKAALAAIILMSVVHMIDIPTVRRIANTRTVDLIVWFSSFSMCLLWSLEFGIIVAVGISLLLEVATTKSQSLVRLRRQHGKWKVDKHKKTDGLPEEWGPTFVRGCGPHIAVKPQGTVTFSMTSAFTDRMLNILHELRSTERTTAIFINFSSSPTIDFTGVMALQDLLAEAKPKRRKSPNSEEGEENFYGTLIYATRLPASTHAIMERAGLFNAKIEFGGWPLLERWTIEEALDSYTRDCASVLAIYPNPWDTPAETYKGGDAVRQVRPFEHSVGTQMTGRDDRPWVIHGNEKNWDQNMWIREMNPTMLAEARDYLDAKKAEQLSRSTSITGLTQANTFTLSGMSLRSPVVLAETAVDAASTGTGSGRSLEPIEESPNKKKGPGGISAMRRSVSGMSRELEELPSSPLRSGLASPTTDMVGSHSWHSGNSAANLQALAAALSSSRSSPPGSPPRGGEEKTAV